MPALVVGHRLQSKVRNARGKVLPLHDLDTSEVERIGCLRRAVLLCKEMVRTRSRHVGEVVADRAESRMLLFGEEEGELALMRAVGVDLFMVESDRTDELGWSEAGRALLSQARVGGEIPVLGEPLRQSTRTEAQAETLLDAL